MTMKFRMKVERLFKVGDKTILAGPLDAQPKVIKAAMCEVVIDGAVTERIGIDGEVSNGTENRDLWTSSSIELNANVLTSHEVWLVEI
ncbi:hypothetical protein L2Y96_10225 [Luteibacter aegosomaticola]|uniref:hypothetical protein n=1 Tax=Luteibacter aegosomaticola TaxID=2911538 RepID=UPI001FF9B2A6|nr:hypothetical protein [Luteibacter aegosomaticola]UPG92117.1 hypothetical protein L2Y96_10225 [Luteibacter aegosomaticola]